MKRRAALAAGLAGATVSAIWLVDPFGTSRLQAAEPDRGKGGFGPEALINGPSAVSLGNPAGDVTVVEFFDYQCPICRRVHPDVEALVKEDGKIRLVHKHWPVFGPASTHAARLALAARWQEGRYAPVHDALMRLPGKLEEARIDEAAQKAGLDLAVLERDQTRRAAEIDAALKEAEMQAGIIGLQGTPAFVIGKYLVPGGLDLKAMREIVAQARTGN